MHNQIRNTGKFQPFEYIIGHNFTTGSTIKVPQHSPSAKLRSIQWRRKYEDLQQKLHHLDNVPEYFCSELDKDFLIQAIIENEVPNGAIQHRINVYGPIFMQPEFNFLLEGLNTDNQSFEVDILSRKKVYSCVIVFSSNQIFIRNKMAMNGYQYGIAIADIINCFINKMNGIDVVTFPTLYSRILVLKLFNEILSKGSYSDNNDPTILKVYDPNQQNPKIRFNLRWKRFLLRLGNLKQDNSRRMSMPVIQSSSNYKIPTVQIEHKKSSQHARYSEDNANTEKKKIESEMKKSQNWQRNQKKDKKMEKPMPSQSDQGENENPYLAEFNNLINDDDEPEREGIELNDSLQEFEKKSRSEKQLVKLQYVKAKKKQREAQNARKRELQQTLQELFEKRDGLLATNTKLKGELEAQKNQNYPLLISTAKMQLAEAKRQLQRLIEDANRRVEEQRWMDRNTKI